MTFLELTEGPLWYAAAGIFSFGVIWRLAVILLFGRKPDRSIPRGSALVGAVKANILHLWPHGGFFTKSGFHLIAGYLFHLGLFVLVFFAAPHVVFIQDNIVGFGWDTLPRWGFILTAEAAFCGLILLWARRLGDPVIRLLTDRDDNTGLWMTFGVMLTGCLALGESSEFLRALHMLSVDIWLIYFPFSRLMHGFTFVFSRGYMGASFGRRGITP
ncbi:MAG: nitrate reductase [Alphaproteobacteria bacterium]|jgi:nitrate reductase gamma subunit|nr:nitrate reductase [Alphaproteobacteria bacterium]MBT7944364.1 nitrate reductase [Alphaproteobacteria bacterium]